MIDDLLARINADKIPDEDLTRIYRAIANCRTRRRIDRSERFRNSIEDRKRCEQEEIALFTRLRKEGKTITEISEETGYHKSLIARRIPYMPKGKRK